MRKISYGRQDITQEDIDAVTEVLRGDFLTQGPTVEKFETEFSNYIGSKFSIAVANGTDALHLAALALGVKPGQKVLVTSLSFVASANCILYCGADVDFVDIDAQNYCLDLVQLVQKIQCKPKNYYAGIVCVDFAGYPFNFEKLRDIANAHQLWIIEDACHAVGGEFLNSKNEVVRSGNSNYADISVFSFHPVKHIAMGEGGMITTNDDGLNKKIRLLRTHGITKSKTECAKYDGPWYYEMQELGYNYRVPDILCALGLSQLKRIDNNLKCRRNIAQTYLDELKNVGDLVLPYIQKDLQHAFHLFVIQTKKRNELFQYLIEHNIYPQVHYIPIHQQPFYVQKYGQQNLPVVEEYYQRAISLPMYHGLTDDDLMFVIKTIRDFYNLEVRK
jgi:UDP-4-amino-4,6-dideoxy-N-acetyl-beta-L-altrosamine transaminase